MSPFKRALRSLCACCLEGALLGWGLTLCAGGGVAVGGTWMGLGAAAGFGANVATTPGPGECCGPARGPLEVPLFKAAPVGAALGTLPFTGAGAAVLTDGPGDLAGTAVGTAATRAAVTAGAGVTGDGDILATGGGAGVFGTGVAGVLVGAAVGAAVGGPLRETAGTAPGKLRGTAAMDCCGRGTKTASVATGLGSSEASGTGFAFDGPCGTILANS